MKKTFILLSLISLFSCTSQTSNKELELIKRENEILKKEKELAEKQAIDNKTEPNEIPKSLNSDNDRNGYKIDSGPISEDIMPDINDEAFITHIKKQLLGKQFSKGIRTWKFVSMEEFIEFRILELIKENKTLVTEMVLSDFYGDGKKYYAKLLLTDNNGKIEISVLDYHKL